MENYELLIKGGNLVIPRIGTITADVAVSDGKIALIADRIREGACAAVIDASDKLVFPGAVDPHFHIGIYRPISENAESESRAAASGGVTTLISYFRTGKDYLNKTGPYRTIFPELLETSQGCFVTDYGYHLAIATYEQLNELEWLISKAGVSEFKFFLPYKGAPDTILSDDPLDLGFLYELMDTITALNENYSSYGTVRLSVHCEEPEVIRVCSKRQKEGGVSGNLSKAYSDARPGWSEALAVYQVGLLAAQTGCPIYLVHLSSCETVEAVKRLSAWYPKLDMMKEATLHHLALSNEVDYGVLGKVNPPIRGREDVECLWDAVLTGQANVIGSDHCSLTKQQRGEDLYTAPPGFGAAPLVFPVLITEGNQKRGLPLERIAELTSLNPAISNNLYPKKGTIMVGTDADLAIVDINTEKTVTASMLHSIQDFTPFEGMTFRGWVDTTILRGRVIFEHGTITGERGYGQHIKRPVRLHGMA